jgi:hypothetical protein
MFSLYLGTDFPTAEYGVEIIYIYASIYLAISLAFYSLRSIGLYVLAKRQNVKHAFIAWIPMIWLYTACKLVGKARFFNKPIEKLAIILTIIFAINNFLILVADVLNYYPLIVNLLTSYDVGSWVLGYPPVEMVKEYVFIADLPALGGVYYNGQIINPYGVGGSLVIDNILMVISYLSTPLSIVSIVIEITVYMGLFRKFWPQHYVLASLLSIFLSLFAPFVFAIRKKQPVNYVDYLRSRYQYPPNHPYGNQYGQYNGSARQAPPQTPFEEFAEKGEKDPGDPFEEFDNKGN